MTTPLPPPQARFTDLGQSMQSELISNHVQLFYDVVTGQASAVFNGNQYLSIAGKYMLLADTADMLPVDFSSQMTRCYAEGSTPVTDPETGADLTKISVAGLMTLIKMAYDIEVNARETARLAAVAAASDTVIP